MTTVELRTKVWIDSGTIDGVYSIARQTYACDCEEDVTGCIHRTTVAKGEIDIAEEFMNDLPSDISSPIIEALKTLWTLV